MTIFRTFIFNKLVQYKQYNRFFFSSMTLLFPVSIEAFLKKAQAKIPSLAGIKFSCCDMVDLTGALNVKAPHRDDGRYNIMFGTDEVIMLLP